MYISGTYFASWSIYQYKHFVTDLPVADITHVFYAFMKIDPNTGEVQLGDSWADAEIPLESPCGGHQVKGSLGQLYELKKKRRYLKTLMSIGGWGTNDTFVAAFLTEQKMNTFVKSAVTMANCYHFDGIDIDWEYPSTDAEARQLLEVLYRLRVALGPDRLISVACPGGDDTFAILRPHLPAMDKYLSFWNVMCYDYAGKSWSQKTGFHSNLFGHNGDNLMSSDSIITKYHEAGVLRHKLVLGMPAYARAFANPAQPSIGLPFDKSTGPDDLEYKNISEKYEQFDHRKVSAFAMDSSRGLFLTYDSPISARIKAKYVELKQLAGGMWWCSYGDQPGERSLVGAFVDQLGRSNLDHTNNYCS